MSAAPGRGNRGANRHIRPGRSFHGQPRLGVMTTRLGNEMRRLSRGPLKQLVEGMKEAVFATVPQAPLRPLCGIELDAMLHIL